MKDDISENILTGFRYFNEAVLDKYSEFGIENDITDWHSDTHLTIYGRYADLRRDKILTIRKGSHLAANYERKGGDINNADKKTELRSELAALHMELARTKDELDALN